ncbi:hypothetical protein X943_000210 [Babesia divergens]|uniref:V-SNARE coiled-coil homology domain-containing protein n=1 Tax=Babesia divergens TaxID=32595 RepID=A0AAD9GKP5_BABDI|nr:hypothetical protein X943_000210 [Babesia divergens]
MTLVVYSLVSKGGSVIADYTAPINYSGTTSQFYVNLDAVARSQLNKIPKGNCSGSSLILGHHVYYNAFDELILICVTNSNEDTDLPRRFLVSELKSSCKPHIINDTNKRSELLTRILSRLVTDYNETSDKLKSIETSLEYTAQSLRGSITSILERGELIDSIVSKSNSLKDETVVFRSAAQRANSSFFRSLFLTLSDCVGTRELAIGVSVSYRFEF